MMQHPDGKPPDEMDELASSRSGSDRRQKSNAHVEQALNCPRCDSTNTKFCYYNNYSLTQPRYFCKNCRRYWTKGGALRNVPVGGGCRKNKRIKQRTMDPSSLVSLDETTSNLLARINTSNCTPLMPNFSAPSSSSFVDLGNSSHSYDLTFPLIQESIRLGGHAGSIHSPAASSPVTAGMLHSSCSQPSLLSSLTAIDTNLMNLSYPNSTVKTEHTGLYNGSSFSSLFETPAQMAAAPTAQLPSLEDQLSSTYSVPIESFNGCGVEAQLRSQQQKFALQLMNKGQVGDQGQILQNFEDETNENLRSIKGKAFLPCGGDGRSLSYWQGVPESLFETTGDSSYWYSNPGWPDLHAIAGSAAGAML